MENIKRYTAKVVDGVIIAPIDLEKIRLENPGRVELGFLSKRDIDIHILPRPDREPENIDDWRDKVCELIAIPPAYSRAKKQWRKCRGEKKRVVKTPVGRITGKDKDGNPVYSPVYHNRHLQAVPRLVGLVSVHTKRLTPKDKTLSIMDFPRVDS